MQWSMYVCFIMYWSICICSADYLIKHTRHCGASSMRQVWIAEICSGADSISRVQRYPCCQVEASRAQAILAWSCHKKSCYANKKFTHQNLVSPTGQGCWYLLVMSRTFVQTFHKFSCKGSWNKISWYPILQAWSEMIGAPMKKRLMALTYHSRKALVTCPFIRPIVGIWISVLSHGRVWQGPMVEDLCRNAGWIKNESLWHCWY